MESGFRFRGIGGVGCCEWGVMCHWGDVSWGLENVS